MAKLSNLYERLGKAFLEVLFESSDVDMKALHALFGHSAVTFATEIGKSNDHFAEALRRSNLTHEEIIKISKEPLQTRLADLMGVKQVKITF